MATPEEPRQTRKRTTLLSLPAELHIEIGKLLLADGHRLLHSKVPDINSISACNLAIPNLCLSSRALYAKFARHLEKAQKQERGNQFYIRTENILDLEVELNTDGSFRDTSRREQAVAQVMGLIDEKELEVTCAVEGCLNMLKLVDFRMGVKQVAHRAGLQ